MHWFYHIISIFAWVYAALLLIGLAFYPQIEIDSDVATRAVVFAFGFQILGLLHERLPR